MRKPAKLVMQGLGVLLVSALGVAGTLAGRAGAAERTDTPWLGVYSQALSADLREAMDYNGEGVLINRVVPDSPADRAGVEKGDIVVSFNSRAVRTPGDLASMVRAARVGQSVRLVVSRDGTRRTLNATLAGWPEGEEPEDQLAPPARDQGEDQGDEEFDVPTPPTPPTPATPRTPRTPRTPPTPDVRMRMFDLPDSPEPTIIRMGRGRLGVRVEDLNADLGGYFQVPDGKGALIVEVLKDTPAERAGLKAGDVITRVGDKTVADASDLIRAVGDADDKVTLRIVRKGQARTIESELDARPRALRLRSGHDMMGLNDPDHIRIYRDLVRRGDGRDDDLREELRDLREQLRQLREELRDRSQN
jgi:serine protease Do